MLSLLVSKEAAYMYAIASAGITHWVTKECYLGRINNCGCNNKVSTESQGSDFKWDCDMDVAIGMKISRKVTIVILQKSHDQTMF